MEASFLAGSWLEERLVRGVVSPPSHLGPCRVESAADLSHEVVQVAGLLLGQDSAKPWEREGREGEGEGQGVEEG